MSWEAAGFVKKLLECPDGAALSRGQKLILFVLADYHDTRKRVAFPSVPTIAEEALTSHAQTKRDLAYLEEHFAIDRVRDGSGRGAHYKYRFIGLDLTFQDALKLRALREPEGAQGEPFISSTRGSSVTPFCPDERGSEGAQKGLTTNTEKGSQGAHGEQRHKEEPEPSTNLKPEPRGLVNSSVARSPRPIYTQRDFDERDYRKLCEARTELLRRGKPQVRDTYTYTPFIHPEVEGTTDAEFLELVRMRVGLTPERFYELLAMFEPRAKVAQ